MTTDQCKEITRLVCEELAKETPVMNDDGWNELHADQINAAKERAKLRMSPDTLEALNNASKAQKKEV